MAERLALSFPPTQLGFPLLNSSLVPGNQGLPGWFVGDPSSNGLEQAQQAFEDAVKEFRTNVSEAECAKWLNGSNTIFDAEQAVLTAKQQYERKSPKSRARKWLASCSSRLMYYSVIMDTLSQHHPEYVSLAWGAVKFLFIAVLNHEELLTEIAKALAKIANMLPRADLSSNLYPTQRMRVAVAQLYAKVLHFIQDAVKWYKKGKLAHSVSAVFKPYSLGFKAIVDEISEASRRVDQEASAASRAEIRELHIKIHQLSQLSIAHFNTQNLAVVQMSDNIGCQTRMLRQQEMAVISSMPALSHLPNAEEALDYCRSVKTRRRRQFLIDPAQIAKLREWHETPNAFPVLVAYCRGLHNTARDFGVEFVDTVRASGIPAIWVLSEGPSEGGEEFSLRDVLLSLAMQALMVNPKAFTEGVNPISSHHFQHSLTEDQCFSLLGRCLRGVSRMYILLSMPAINAAVGYHGSLATAFIQRLLKILLSQPARGIKLVVMAEDFGEDFDIENEVLEETQLFVVGQTPGPLKRKGARRGFTRYSSHCFPLPAGTKGITDWLSTDGNSSQEN